MVPAIAVGEHADVDDGPESDAGPCCAKCASSSSSFWRGCDGAGDVIIPGKSLPVSYPVVRVAPMILTAPPVATKPGPPIYVPRAPSVLLSRTGAMLPRIGVYR